MNRWPASLAVAEGMENARSGGWISLLLAVAVTWITVGVGLLSALEVGSLVSKERAWIEAGANVMVVESSGDGGAGVDVAACDRLTRITGISGAFAASVTASTLEPANAPGTGTTLVLVSPGAYAFAQLDVPPGVGVLAPLAAAAQTGIADQEKTTFTQVDALGSRTRFRAVTVLTRRLDLGSNLEGSLLLPSLLEGRADACYVRADPGYTEATAVFLQQALSSPGAPPLVVRPMLTANSFGLDFRTAYDERILGWAWAGGALGLGALWALIQRTRRARTAIYQTFGAHRFARAIMQLAEWATISLPAVSWGWSIALLSAIAARVDPRVALTQISCQTAALWCAASLLVAAIAVIPAGEPLAALKDRS